MQEMRAGFGRGRMRAGFCKFAGRAGSRERGSHLHMPGVAAADLPVGGVLFSGGVAHEANGEVEDGPRVALLQLLEVRLRAPVAPDRTGQRRRVVGSAEGGYLCAGGSTGCAPALTRWCGSAAAHPAPKVASCGPGAAAE